MEYPDCPWHEDYRDLSRNLHRFLLLLSHSPSPGRCACSAKARKSADLRPSQRENPRGHQNSLEMMPMFFMLMIVGGLRHPCACACLELLYIVSRFFYFKGYATGDP
ncbi:hypothetical protein NL676_014482 [Syzygium grande]|nr:hypothetical protein NL676_014482 [Syzygium grande]